VKIATLTCIGIGLLGALLAGLTALGAVPGFVDFGLGLGDIVGSEPIKDVLTSVFWGGLAILALLAAIGFGVIAPKE